MWFIALFHLAMGFGLMFSVEFQGFIIELYGVRTDWTVQSAYFTRVIGSFAFVLGFFAAYAARNPLKYQFIVIGYIAFFILRNIHRHLFYDEVYNAFLVSPFTNNLTSLFFGIQAIGLIIILWQAKKEMARTES